MNNELYNDDLGKTRVIIRKIQLLLFYGSMKARAMHESIHIKAAHSIKVRYFFQPPLFFPRPFPFRPLSESSPLLEDISDDSTGSPALSVKPLVSPDERRTSWQRYTDRGGGLSVEYIGENDEDVPAVVVATPPAKGVLAPRRSFIDVDRLVEGDGDRRREDEERIGDRDFRDDDR